MCPPRITWSGIRPEVASRKRANAREREAGVRQTLFEFVVEHDVRPDHRLDPKVREELVARMAEAILAVVETKGGQSDERPREQS